MKYTRTTISRSGSFLSYLVFVQALAISSALAEANARQELGPESTLSDYLAYGALHNPGLKSAVHRWNAALQKIPQVTSFSDPKFHYSYFIREVETRVGPQEQKIGLSQTFPWFGTHRLYGEAGMESANVLHQQVEAKTRRLFYRIKKSYYEFYYLARSIAITEDNIELLKHLESVAQAKYKSGSSVLGVLKAQVELGKLIDRLHTLQDFREPITAKLNAALNRPTSASLPWPRSWVAKEVPYSSDDLLAFLGRKNPELLALDAAVRREEVEVALAKKKSLPDITLGVDYIVTDEALTPGIPDSGKDPLVAKVSISVPLWREKNQASVEEAKHRRMAAINTRKDKENDLAAELKMALYRLRDAERKMSLFRDTLIPEAKQSMQVTEEAYRSGSTDFLNLVDAQRLLLEFELSFERARVDREKQVAEIEMLIGEDLNQLSNSKKGVGEHEKV